MTVPSGVTVTLDLNGKTIKKYWTAETVATDKGNVIVNKGTLTIVDGAGGGQITGGIASGNGGGIYNEGSLTFAGGTITLNHADGNGGGIYNKGSLALTGGAITGNTAGNTGKGNGIYNDGTISVSGAPVVTDNGGSNIYLPSSHATMTVAGELESGANLQVTAEKKAGTITSGYGANNSAEPREFFHAEGAGLSVILKDGEVCFANTATSWAGLQDMINNSKGETYIALGQTLTAASNENAIQIPSGKNIILDLNGNSLDRGLTKKGDAGHVIQMKGTSTLTIQNSDDRLEGKVMGGWSMHGGGINVESDSTCIIKSGNIDITKNHADYGGGIYSKGTLIIEGGRVVDNEAKDGAGVYNDGGTLTVTGGTIFGNAATEYGGGIYNKGTMGLSDCIIQDNTAKERGGGIYFDKKPNEQSLNNVTITGNLALKDEQGGGGFYLQTGTVTMTGGEVSDNHAKDGAGGYVTDNTTLKANGTLFKSNVTENVWDEEISKIGKSGGAFVNHGTVELEDCTIEENEADHNGGAIWSDSKLTLKACTVKNNKLNYGLGGGIYVKGGTALLNGCTISGNIVNGYLGYADRWGGGGIANDGTLTCEDCTITDNAALGGGGGIYNTGKLFVTNASWKDIANNHAWSYYETGNGKSVEGYGGGIYVKSGSAELTLVNMTGNDANNVGGGICCESDGKVSFFVANKITDNQTSSGGNTAGEGGGVYMAGTMNADGDLIIENNKAAFAGYDLYLVNGKKINVVDFGPNTHIGVATPTGTGVITNGYKKVDSFGRQNPDPSEWFFVSGGMSDYVSIRKTDTFQAELYRSGGKVSYYNPLDGKTRNLSINDGTVVTSETTEMKTGWYFVLGDTDVPKRIKVDGIVYLLLKDGATLEALNGITVEGDNSLTVWGQTESSGKLKADVWHHIDIGYSGIGGKAGNKAGEITINGGIVEATSSGGAAIGSGSNADGGKVVINYGTVSAVGNYGGAGIGNGTYNGGAAVPSDFKNAGTITITGGTVTAKGGEGGGAGIGGGRYRNGGNVTITGGTVTAIGGESSDSGGAGIGGGYHAAGGTITITGGHVTATAQGGTAGIGNGGSRIYYGNDGAKTKIVLDYTSTDMSVNASWYSPYYPNGGTLTLKKPFKNADDGSQVFAAAANLGYRSTDDHDSTIIRPMHGVTMVPHAYTVTFDTDGAGQVASQVVVHGNTAQKPKNPYKKGLIFTGWRLVTDGQMSPTDFDFSTPITEDTPLKAFYVDPNDLGLDRYVIETRDDAPVIDSDNMFDVVNKTLSQEELNAGAYLLLVSSPLIDVPSDDRAALESEAKALGATPGMWFDISLYRVLGEEQTKLSKAGTPVQLKASVPETLHKDGRTFYLLRYHDGKATLAAQGEGPALEWETDEFSTYMLSYKDSDSSAPEGNTPASASGTPVAKTGDSIPAGMIGIILACAALSLAAGIAALRHKDEWAA